MFICSFSGPLFIEHFRVGCIFTLSLIFAKYFVAPPPLAHPHLPHPSSTPFIVYMVISRAPSSSRVYLCTFANFREFCRGNEIRVNCLTVVYFQSKPHKKELEGTLLSDPNCQANFAVLIFFGPFETSVSVLDTRCTVFVFLFGAICTLPMQ